MNRIQSVMKMHLRDQTTWFKTPSIIIAVSFALSLTLACIMKESRSFNSSDFSNGMFSSVFIYPLAVGAILLKETFPFALGLSVRRKDYFWGAAAAGIAVNAISGIALAVLSVIEGVTNGWGVRLHYFRLEFLADVPLIGIIGIYTVVFMHMHFLGLALASLHRRLGRNGMITFFIGVLWSGTIVTYSERWGAIFGWLFHHYMELFWWMIPATLCYLLIAYALLRKATV